MKIFNMFKFDSFGGVDPFDPEQIKKDEEAMAELRAKRNLGATGQVEGVGETKSESTEQEADPFAHGGDRGKQVIVETTNK